MIKFIRENFRLIGFGLLLTFFSGFGQTFLISLYVPVIGEEFGLTNSLFGSIFAAITLLSAACLPFAGKLIDKFSLKHYSISVFFLLALSLSLTAFSIHPVMLVLGLWGIRFAGQGLMSHTSITSMARYFDQARGKAISIAALGYPLGEAVLPILIALSISAFGWRYSMGISAILLLVVLLPYVFKVVRFPQPVTRDANESSAEEPNAARSWTQREVLRSRFFWIIGPNAFVLPMLSTGLFFYQISMAEFKGWTAEWVALSFIFFAAASSLSMVLSGILVDRWKAARLFPYYFIPYAIGLFILASFDHPWIVPVYLTLLGITTGFGSTIKSALQAELFGTVSLGAVRSLFTTFMVASTAAGPVIFGFALDGGLNFNQLIMGCLFFVLLIILHSFRIYTPYTRKKAYVKWKYRTRHVVTQYQKLIGAA